MASHCLPPQDGYAIQVGYRARNVARELGTPVRVYRRNGRIVWEYDLCVDPDQPNVRTGVIFKHERRGWVAVGQSWRYYDNLTVTMDPS